MPLQIVRNDITKMKVDAIVNAANESLLGGGGVDGCIHRAAGPELLAECETLHGCKTGSAKITKGYRLPCKYVIHAVGPRWYDGRHGECELLISCYRTSLMLAKEYGCESIAFPLISSGIFGYPKDQALKVAIDTTSSFLLENEMTVYIVIFDRKAYQISGKLFADIASYIDDRYVDEHTDSRFERLRRMNAFQMEEPMPCESSVCDEAIENCDEAIEKLTAPMAVSSEKAATLDDALEQIDESFSEMLLRKIDERGMTDAQCYGLDTSYGWMIFRAAFPWTSKRRPEIKALSLTMEQQSRRVPGPHFKTHAPGDSFSFSHPVSGTKYTLTVQEMEQQTISEKFVGSDRWFYPTHFTAMSYTLSPEPDNDISICDCAEGDKPLEIASCSDRYAPEAQNDIACIGIIGGADGPIAIVCGGSSKEKLHAACSSLHFEPVEGDIEWRVVFNIKNSNEMSLELI